MLHLQQNNRSLAQHLACHRSSASEFRLKVQIRSKSLLRCVRPQPRCETGLWCSPIVWTVRSYLLAHVIWQPSRQRTSARRSFHTHVFLPQATHCTDQTILLLWCSEERGSFPLQASVLRVRSLLSQRGELDVFSWVMRVERCVFSTGRDSAASMTFTVATLREKNSNPKPGVSESAGRGTSSVDCFHICTVQQLSCETFGNLFNRDGKIIFFI